jgi:hypothetical protein
MVNERRAARSWGHEVLFLKGNGRFRDGAFGGRGHGSGARGPCRRRFAECPDVSAGVGIGAAGLALSEEQAVRLQRLREQEEQSARTFFRGIIGMSQEQIQARLGKRASAERARIAKILTPLQMQRLNEINLQAAGVAALGFDEVAGAIELTANQRKQLQELGKESRRQLTKLYMANNSQRKVGRNQEARKRKQQKVVAERSSKAIAVLTNEQKEKFAQLQGEPFDVSTIKPRQRNISSRGRLEAPPVIPGSAAE